MVRKGIRKYALSLAMGILACKCGIILVGIITSLFKLKFTGTQMSDSKQTKTIVSLHKLYFNLEPERHTVSVAETANTICKLTQFDASVKAAIGDNPLEAVLALRAEIRLFLLGYIKKEELLADFSFTIRRSPVSEAGAFRLFGVPHLTQLPMTGSLLGKV